MNATKMFDNFRDRSLGRSGVADEGFIDVYVYDHGVA
tara:strand:- start:174 stop:284 length:111 start_codon:yes stop_codon:yes gene_type:complete